MQVQARAILETSDAPTLHLRQVLAIVGDLQQRSPLIYWTDFLLSSAAAWTACVLYFIAPTWSALQLMGLVGASVFFFRAGTFIHEIIHFQRGEMPWFRRAWNLIIGIPLLMPWIVYRNHLDHHSPRTFGTPEDGEYLPLAAAPVTETVRYLLQAPLLPLFVVARFGVLGPLSCLNAKLRNWVLTAASAAVSNPYYRKRFAADEEAHLRLVEVLCFAYLATIALLLAFDVVTALQVLEAYLLLAATLTLNWIRNLAAHRYANRGERMSHVEQFGDSINLVGQTWLTVLMFPVGLRYHALHHLLPSLPYHNLGKAHQRLVAALPADSPYHAACRTSFLAITAELWRAARRTRPADSAVHRWRQQVRTQH